METTRRNARSRTINPSLANGYKVQNLVLLCFLSTILLVAVPPLPPASAFGGIGFASAFVATTAPARLSHERITSTRRRATSSAESPKTETDLWTLEDLEDYASSESVNVVVSFTTFGPGYRAVARAKHDESIVMGYVEGFLRPTQPKILHLDSMVIFQPVLERVRKTHPNTLNFGGVSIGLGVLMGYRCLLHATEASNGPREIAEFLAIDDEDFQHKRLVRYYKRAGFTVVKYVGEDVGSIPDRLVWGGCGTLMNADIPVLMGKWTTLMKKMKRLGAKRDLERTAKSAEAAEASKSEDVGGGDGSSN